MGVLEDMKRNKQPEGGPATAELKPMKSKKGKKKILKRQTTKAKQKAVSAPKAKAKATKSTPACKAIKKTTSELVLGCGKCRGAPQGCAQCRNAAFAGKRWARR